MSPYEVLGIGPGTPVEDVRKAYRELARRWHPDRFAPGPERMWAEDKMITINQAYAQVLHGDAPRPCEQGEADPQFQNVRRLLDAGQITQARAALMRIVYRSAEWNYLFGAVLMRLGEYEKAATYFGVAAAQHPGNLQYRTALGSARAVGQRQAGGSLLSKVSGALEKTRRSAEKLRRA